MQPCVRTRALTLQLRPLQLQAIRTCTPSNLHRCIVTGSRQCVFRSALRDFLRSPGADIRRKRLPSELLPRALSGDARHSSSRWR